MMCLIQSLLQEVWGEAEEEWWKDNEGDDDTMGMIDSVGHNHLHEGIVMGKRRVRDTYGKCSVQGTVQLLTVQF